MLWQRWIDDYVLADGDGLTGKVGSYRSYRIEYCIVGLMAAILIQAVQVDLSSKMLATDRMDDRFVGML